MSADTTSNISAAVPGSFLRSSSKYRHWISSDPRNEFPAEPDRYHLYISRACPWACGAAAVLHMKGLQHTISMSVTHPTWKRTRPNLESDTLRATSAAPQDAHAGWVFRSAGDAPLSGPTGMGSFECDDDLVPDSVNGVRTVRELYELCGATVGPFSVPVLWDKKSARIVNNESWDIMRMLNAEFNGLARNPNLDLFPVELQQASDEVFEWVYACINDGVYRCGFAKSQAAYDEATEALYGALDRAESLLSRQRYLLGGRLTLVDIRLFMTLLRFDSVYVCYFKCLQKRIVDYPNLRNYCRELFQVDDIRSTINMRHIVVHYYTSHPTLNHFGIIPKGPDVTSDFSAQHDRDRFAQGSRL